MIYLIIGSYAPNTAATNRFMGLLKAFSERNIDVTVCFFMSDENNSKAPDLPHVTYKYYWNQYNPKIVKLKLLFYLVYATQFVHSLKYGDVIYAYNCNEILSSLVSKRGVRVYHERTEHPLVSKLKVLNVRKYLKACKAVDGLFVISNPLKEYFCSIGVDRSKVYIVNMTVDATRFNGLTKRNCTKYIAYCGNGSNNKDGVDQLIKAFSITTQSHPDVKLYIIGPMPKKFDSSGNLELIEKLGLSSKVIFTGIVSSSDIPQILKNAQVLALNRPDNVQAKYGFPTKLGEYLLAGNPVVVTSVGDIPLFLKNKETALLAEPSNPEHFSNQLNWALDNYEDALAIGQQGRQVALTSFNSDSEALKIIKVITQNDQLF